jgi:predicted nucleotidyltransferase
MTVYRKGKLTLGRDLREIAAASTHAQIIKLLADTKQVDRLLMHMAAALRGVEDPVEVAGGLLEQFKIGLTGA